VHHGDIGDEHHKPITAASRGAVMSTVTVNATRCSWPLQSKPISFGVTVAPPAANRTRDRRAHKPGAGRYVGDATVVVLSYVGQVLQCGGAGGSM
jgi:hypothetical protein